MAEIKKGATPKPKAPNPGKVKGTEPKAGDDKGKGKPPPFGKVKGC